MYKNIFFFLFFTGFFTACTVTPQIKTEDKISPSEKVFAEEDMYIMVALYAEEVNDRKTAADFFEKLYAKSQKKEYLYRSLENNLIAKKNQKVIDRVDKLTKGSLNDYHLIRLKVVALVESFRIFEARELELKLLALTKAEEDYLLMANIYIQQQEYTLALQYLESAYSKNHNEKILDKIAVILYSNLHNTKEAIAQLQTHSRTYGCSTLICNRLLGIYSNENNLDGLLSTYKKLYVLNQDNASAKKIVQIYTYKKDYKNLVIFLEKSGTDDDILLQLYASKKEYKKAEKLADTLFKEKGTAHYLGQSAIYEYEANSNNHTPKVLKSVISKLQRVIEMKRTPLYLNYLGYILIDHDLDVKGGMLYIKEVLTLRPDSAFYLDSLAWGYYKQGQCKKAKKLMNRIVTLKGGDDPEVLKHVKQINKCLKTKKGKSKK